MSSAASVTWTVPQAASTVPAGQLALHASRSTISTMERALRCVLLAPIQQAATHAYRVMLLV